MVYNISDSKEGVEDRNDYAKQVDMLKDSKILVVDGSNPKSDRSLGTQTTNGISANDTTNGISTQKIYPLFIKPVIQSVKLRSRVSCGSPSFAVTSVSLTRIWNQDIFSPSDSSTVRRGRNAEPLDASIGLSTAQTADKLKSVIVLLPEFEG